MTRLTTEREKKHREYVKSTQGYREPLGGVVRELLGEVDFLRAALDEIKALDIEPQLHAKDASKCAICIAKKAREPEEEDELHQD
jgi:hypothetical protein